MSPLALGSVGSFPIRIDASSETPVTIKAVSGSTLYYKSTENVSSSSNDGSAVVGASVTVVKPTFFVSGGTTQYSYVQKGFENKGMSRWQTFVQTAENQGNNTTPVAGTFYYAECKVLSDALLTGMEVVQGETIGTDKMIVWLWDRSGVVVANSAVAGAITTTAKGYQQFAFETPYLASSGKYYAGVQVNGTTTRVSTIKAKTVNTSTGSVTGEFGVSKAITPPTTFTENVGPILTTY